MIKKPDDNIISLLKLGNVKCLAEGLGYYYSFQGVVVRGNKIGRELGFPTANIEVNNDTIIPANGVYAAMGKFSENWYEAMVNIGVRPTLGLKDITIEAHLFGVNQDLYGKEISLHFIEKIRDEIKFSNLDNLKSQLIKDRESASIILKNIKLRLNPKDNHCFYYK
ncbi:MAG: hypothetical protein KGZ97_05630 [Bacteroidetes bacterium]|nr:hypothetical protein [Bacteroidota bacterium]